MTDHRTLLAEYAANGSEEAFRELVACYIDLVYSTAVRLVNGDTHRAEDVAQTVFADLARLAGKISPERHARRLAAPAHVARRHHAHAQRTPPSKS